MKKADVAYANARKAANEARQKATDAKNLAGESGVRDLKQAEANLPAAIKAVKLEAEKTRAAYLAARNIADDKRALAEQAKAALYRLVAARQVANLMESSDPPKPANRIDEIVFAELKALGIQPILCSDAVFLRRACLDLTGTLPSAEEAKAFIQSSDKNKRVALVDRLLDRSEHVDYWALKWSDILRVNELTSTQWLHMLNSATIQRKLQSGPKLASLISPGGKPNEIAERLYLTILSRFPTAADVKAAEEHANRGVTDANGAWVDLAWALINSPEFLLRH